MNSLNRRNFLKKTGAGAVALETAGPWITNALAKNSPNETINVAVMGIRSRGKHHIKNYIRIPNVNVTVLCDIDERLFPEAVAELEKATGKRPKTETDIRRVIEDKDVDVISIASPNHWHSLAAIWACQAGKDVYVEKPVSHNIFEGRKMVEAARRYDRIVQTGSQRRSDPMSQSAMDFIHSGKLGKIYMIKCVIFRPRESFGRGRITPVPEGVHYDLFRGPALMRPFNVNRFHYNWHWFWDTGNGETGNNGPHFTDMVCWALKKNEHPRKIQSMGDYYVFDCEQETPNTQISCMEYADGEIVQLEVRCLYTNRESEMTMGMLFFGSEGWMKYDLSRSSWATFYGRGNEPGYAETRDKYSNLNIYGQGRDPHFKNFIDCVRSRNREDLAADILKGHLSASMCHLCNIAYRTGRTLIFDSESESFIGDDEAQKYLTREYRRPFVVPEKV